MAESTKTYVMILQELAVKHNIIPKYELIYSKQGTHENIFHFKVAILHEIATGVGRSKREAKQKAACKALELLANKDIFRLDVSNEYTCIGDLRPEHIETEAPFNCKTTLRNICATNKISAAEYTEVSVAGEQHLPQFTYECRVSYVVTRATARSKKHAKQKAAKEMLEKIKNMIPEIQERMVTDQLTLTKNDRKVRKKYMKLTTLTAPQVNFNSKVIEHDNQFKQMMKDRCIDEAIVKEILSLAISSDVLTRLLEIFNLKYEVITIQESPVVLMISINSNMPVTVLEMASTIEEATQNAMMQMHTILTTFLL